MAIIGGAGNPVGGFTGAAQALEYIGTRVYAYSGLIDGGGGGSADQVALKFTTGSALLEVTLNIYYTGLSTEAVFINVFMNDTQIVDARADASGAGIPLLSQGLMTMIIPPYTEFELKVGDNGSGKTFSVLLSGEQVE
jgi:hypothetical protein